MTTTHVAKRIEVLVDAPLVPRIAEALNAAGATGYSVFRALSGSGRGGQWAEEQVTAAESKLMVVAITTGEHADAVVDRLAPLLDSHGLLLTLSDVAVVRPQRFA